MDTLEPQSTSFISAELQARYSDVLFRTRITGREAYIYLLIEHQSSNDPLMALRILEYMIQIWNHHLSIAPKARTLPAVIPLVVHRNPNGCTWTAPRDINDLIDLDRKTRDAAAPYLPHLRYLLDDINRIDIASLMARNLTPPTVALLALLKLAPGNTHLGTELQILRDTLKALIEGHNGVRDFRLALTYIIRVGDTDPAELEAFIDDLGPDAKEAFMTTAERLEQRGEARGEARGELNGAAKVLLEQLPLKFGQLPEHIVTTVRSGTAEQLQRWAAAFVTAERLDQIFEDHVPSTDA